jgi:NAD(P)-dependent dehydrogenase (short-subunit alcohol dehydrogenase family)
MTQIVVINQGSGPLGLSLARHFGLASAQVVIVGRDLTEWAQAQPALQAAGVTLRLEALAGRGYAADEYAALAGRLGSIDVWINQVPPGNGGPAESLPAEVWDAQLAGALSSAFFGAQAAAQVMLPRGRGVIINLTYENGRKPVAGQVAANVAHAGLLALTESLGIEWARRGLRVVGLSLAPEGAEAHLPRLPLRRLGTPDEIAEAVAFLASDQASYITAETLRVDGGWGAYQLF